MKIAIFSTMWGSSTGGIDVCSREIIEAMTQKKGMEVCAFYQVRNKKLIADSERLGFLALTPSTEVQADVDASSLGKWSETQAQAVILQLLPQKFVPDYVILNDIFGREILPVVSQYLPDTKIITLVHSAYGRSEARKGVEDTEIVRKENYQREMIEASDLSISIGSFALEYLKNIAPGSHDKIDYVLPGLPNIQSQAEQTNRFNAASFGRLDKKSDTIKQISVSARAWEKARKSGVINKLVTDDVNFYAIGSRGNEAVLKESKEAIENTWRANIRELPFEEIEDFDSSELKRELEKCSFVLLNSWYENFGLTFLETSVFGVPTIISSSSGFYHDAVQILGEDHKHLLLAVDTEGSDAEELALKIEKVLISCSANYDETFENAAKLSGILRQRWPSWSKITDDLLEKMQKISPEPTISENAPSVVSKKNDQTHTPEDKIDLLPWKETLGDLLDWSWSRNIQYYQKLKSAPAFKDLSVHQLTGLQKKFWDKKSQLLDDGFRDVILSGGTSSGKTTLAEMFFGFARPNEFARSRILYVAPTKALAQEKARDWKGKFPSPNLAKGNFEPVIVSTGDDNASDGALIRGEFNIASTVYEKANVILSASQELFNKINLVIIDEFHMVEDLHRGNIIESLLAKIRKEKEKRLASVDEDNHLRVVIITTEGTSTSLKDYLSHVDLETLDNVSPLLIEDSSRAKPVSHMAFFPGRSESQSVPVLEIKNFDTEERLTLSDREAEVKYSEYAQFRGRLSQIDGGNNLDRRQLRWDQYREFIDTWMAQNPVGARILIFMNSKYEVIEVAKFIKNLVKKRTFIANSEQSVAMTVNQDGIDKVTMALDDVEPTDFSQDIRRCLQEGVFVHDSDVPQSVRASFENYLSSELPVENRSEIILATETLSYGVNLRVSDVALFNVLFPEGERIQTKKPKSILLTRCDFVNMSGRAGRLGQIKGEKPAHVYWYLDPEEEKSFEAVIQQFYLSTPTVSSNLFHKADTRVFLNYQSRTPKRSDKLAEKLVFGDALEKFSYPFVRTVLDGLRFLGGTEANTGFLEKVGCTETELIEGFFRNSFYFHEMCKVSDSDHLPDDAAKRSLRTEYLEESIRHVLASANSAEYRLVREPKTGGFQITALGSSTIDTGTEIGTVSRLRQAILELNSYWEDKIEKTLPFEMAVLPLFFQPEVHRQFLLRLPEFNHAMDWNPVENRSDLLNRVTSSLAAMGAIGDDHESDVRQVTQKFLDWTISSQPIVSEPGRYEESAHDGCLRLYIAFLAWISGASLKGVIGEVQKLYPSAPTKTESSVFNFESFADNLTWKILFLISLIRTSEENILPPSSTFDAVRFVHRARFGCVEHAIPLLFKNKDDGPPLNRVSAHALLENGNTTASIAIGGLDQSSGLNAIMNTRTTRQVRRFIEESFEELARQFNYLASGSGQNKDNEDCAKAYWDFARMQVSSLIKSAQKDDALELNFKATASIEDLHDDVALNNDSRLLLSKAENGIKVELFTPIIDGDELEKVKTKKTSEFTAHFVFDESDRVAAQSVASGEKQFFVDFPWAAGAIGKHAMDCRISPAAFGIVLSLCARNFVVDVSSYLHSLLSEANQKPVGVRELYKLSERHLRKNTFPEAIFEAWAKYIEVGEF